MENNYDSKIEAVYYTDTEIENIEIDPKIIKRVVDRLNDLLEDYNVFGISGFISSFSYNYDAFDSIEIGLIRLWESYDNRHDYEKTEDGLFEFCKNQVIDILKKLLSCFDEKSDSNI